MGNTNAIVFLDPFLPQVPALTLNQLCYYCFVDTSVKLRGNIYPPPTSKIVALEKPKAPKNVTFANTIEQLPPSQENDFGDPHVILHTRDPRK